MEKKEWFRGNPPAECVEKRVQRYVWFQRLNNITMKKRVLKKSEVLREGYEQGLREGLNIINQMIAEANGEQLNEGKLQQWGAAAKAWGSKVADNISNNINSRVSEYKANRAASNQQKQANDYDD